MNYNGSFVKCKKYLYDQASKAMFALLKKARYLNLPIDIQLELFDATVLPIMLYGCEVWGVEKLDLPEKLQRKFCKLILGLKESTPTCVLYGELGRYPVSCTVKSRLIGFWHKLNTGKESKLSSCSYKTLLSHYNNSSDKKYPWLKFVHQTLNYCGMSNIWDQPGSVNNKWLCKAVKLRLSFNYRLYKHDFGFEPYLVQL